jgi:sugar lactone lactonase YvrE
MWKRRQWASLVGLGFGVVVAAVLMLGGVAWALSDKLADAVLGQPNFGSGGCNQGLTSAAATTLCFPFGLAQRPSDAHLFVADAANNRVLSWPDASAFTNAQPAELVLGQSTFTSRIVAANSAGLRSPAALTFDGVGRVWVADADNNRLTRFGSYDGTTTSLTSGMAASVVLGQPTFTTTSCGITESSLCGPNALAFQNGALYVADAVNHRVVRFSQPFTNGRTADLVLGQSTFTNGTSATANNRLNQPQGVFLDSGGNAWVADTGNHRVLRFSVPLTSGQAADLVLGQANFTSGGSGTSADRFNLPLSPQLDGQGRLWVADYSNSRVLRFGPPFSSGMSADYVLGQADFTSGEANRGLGTPGRNRLNFPSGLVFRAQKLYVVDQVNHRLLRFD